MACLLIVAHAPLATALRSVAQHVYPDCLGQLGAIDVEAGASSEAVEVRIRLALQVLPQRDVLIMTDVFGATPCNAALAVADGQHVRVVAGVNVPMVWRALCYSDSALDDLVVRAVAGAGQGVMQVAVPRRQNQPSPQLSHDQVQDQHQQ